MGHLRAVLDQPHQTQPSIRSEKCQLEKAEVIYLGHVIGQGCCRPSEIKTAAVAQHRRSKTKTDTRIFRACWILPALYRELLARGQPDH